MGRVKNPMEVAAKRVKRMDGHRPLAERMAVRTIKTPSGCWRWIGTIDSSGYGKLGNAMAHRRALECVGVEIPEGFTVDHLCRHTWCVNPLHLQPVTILVNVRRGMSPTTLISQGSRCGSGHLYTDETSYRRASGRRICRICSAEAYKRWKIAKYGTEATPGRGPSRAASAQSDVECPYCGAAPADPCRTPATGRVTRSHSVRVRAAAVAA